MASIIPFLKEFPDKFPRTYTVSWLYIIATTYNWIRYFLPHSDPSGYYNLGVQIMGILACIIYLIIGTILFLYEFSTLKKRTIQPKPHPALPVLWVILIPELLITILPIFRGEPLLGILLFIGYSASFLILLFILQ
jgi:hypothetical protein